MMKMERELMAQMTADQRMMLELLRDSVEEPGPKGLPDILPMWRAGSGVELDEDRDELKALHMALAKLRDTEGEAYRVVVAFAHKPQGLGSVEDGLLILEALDALEAYVDEMMRG